MLARELYYAINRGDFESANHLLDQGATVDYRDAGGFPNTDLTSLHWAAFYGDLALVERLWKAGAEIDAVDRQGRTPLVCAAMTGKAEVVDFLIENGADVSALKYPGWTLIPVFRRPSGVMEILKARGFADIAEGSNVDMRHLNARSGKKATAEPNAITYPDFEAGMHHQELYSFIFHGLAQPLGGVPSNIGDKFISNMADASKTLNTLGVPHDPLQTFEDVARELMSRSDAQAIVETDGAEAGGPLSIEARKGIRLLDKAMSRIRETLPRENSMRYTMGIHVASVCFHTTMFLNAESIFKLAGKVLVREYAKILIGNADFTRKNLDLYLGTSNPDVASMPSFLQCLLMVTEIVEDTNELNTKKAEGIIKLIRDLFDFLTYSTVTFDVVAALRFIYDPDLQQFMEAVERLQLNDTFNREVVNGSGDFDINNRIEAVERELKSAGDNAKFEAVLKNLLSGLIWERYQQKGSIVDLDLAIARTQEILTELEGTPAESSIRNNLGLALENRFNLNADLSELDAAIDHLTQAVYPKFPLSQSAPMWRHNLGNVLRTRYLRLKDQTDLQLALINLTRAVQQTPMDSPDRGLHEHSLAHAFKDKYELSNDLANLDQAINLYASAADRTKDGSADRPKFFGALAVALKTRHDKIGNKVDMNRAIQLFRRAVTLSKKLSVSDTLRFSYGWGVWAFKRRSWEEAVEALRSANDASHSLHKTQTGRTDKELWLRFSQGLGPMLAQAQCELELYDDAVVSLENSIARQIAEKLDLRRLQQIADSDLDTDAFELYQKTLEQLEAAERAAQISARGNIDALTEAQVLRLQLEKLIDLADSESGSILRRELNFSEIQKAASNCVIVYLSATDEGGFALAVTKDCVRYLPLPELRDKEVISTFIRMNSTYDAFVKAQEPNEKGPSTHAEILEKTYNAWKQSISDTCHWLWSVSMKDVVEILRNDKLPIVLVPVGLLSLLPFHGAFEESSQKALNGALDELITITYAPTARCLLDHKLSETESVFVVHSPDRSRAVKLPFAAFEAQSASTGFKVHGEASGEQANIKAVLERLTDFDVVHFSCHGYADLLKPLKSGLSLTGDELLTLEDLLKRPFMKPSLIVLSACRTGVTSITLPDETISLASGLIQAGARSVVSSLWSVGDVSTALLMDRFYQLWRREKKDPTSALKLSQQWLRDSTRGKLLDYYRHVIEHANDYNTPMATAMAFIDELNSRGGRRNDRLFREPIHWAPFYWSGAIGSS